MMNRTLIRLYLREFTTLACGLLVCPLVLGCSDDGAAIADPASVSPSEPGASTAEPPGTPSSPAATIPGNGSAAPTGSPPASSTAEPATPTPGSATAGAPNTAAPVVPVAPGTGGSGGGAQGGSGSGGTPTGGNGATPNSAGASTGGGGAGGAAAGGAPSQPAPHWVGTWMSAPQLTEESNLPPQPGLAGNTLRQNFLVTIGGSRVRLSFSNQWGDGPVTFEAVHLALAATESSIDPATDTPLTFEGQSSVTLGAGETATSDTLDFNLPPSTRVAVSIHFGDVPGDITGHPGSRTTSFLQSGGAASSPDLSSAVTTDHWYFATSIDVEAETDAAAVVTLGDSITDGRGSTTNGNDRWPNWLARRMQENPATQNIAVLNAGIGGNAVVSGGLGPTVLERFERDVLDQSGVRWVIILEGVNDIGESTSSVAAALIDAYQVLIEQAHARDVLVYGVPILPLADSFYDTAARLEDRQQVNEWIRTSGAFDAVIDLDEVVRDPSDAERLLPQYDSGDFLHPNPAGYEAMGAGISLDLFVLQENP